MAGTYSRSPQPAALTESSGLGNALILCKVMSFSIDMHGLSTSEAGLLPVCAIDRRNETDLVGHNLCRIRLSTLQRRSMPTDRTPVSETRRLMPAVY